MKDSRQVVSLHEDTKKECPICEGCGWDFKDKPPPYPPCKCRSKKKEEEK